MGKALYREYRPKSLNEVIGQEHITNTLSNAIKKDAISHAYLFTGPRGVGKTSVARILAHEINNIDYTDESIDLDIIEIDAASNRRIDEVRDLRDKVHIAPTSSKYKVYIIDEVHMLTREAFNALLKTLEEPPEHVVFILATTELHKVPDTIVSRTQKYTFKPIYNDSVIKHLKKISKHEKIDIDDEALELIAEHGNGSFRDSISMLDQITGFKGSKITASIISELLGFPDSKNIDNLINSVAKSDVNELFDSIQSLKEKGSNPSKISQSIIKKLRDNLLENKTDFDPNKSISIMKSLLPLSGAQSSFEGIEIALLDSINFSNNLEETRSEPIIKITKSTNNGNDKMPDKVVEEIEIQDLKNSEVKDKKGNWNDVLNTLKLKNNTLYGVLRMAETKVIEDKIILTFQFEFHKKQLNNSKNISTLKKIVDERLGVGYIIESEVVKKTKISHDTKNNNKENNTISSVSNIFGGAELLES
jgi:DNA polymerase-3 subunit gamma/tau